MFADRVFGESSVPLLGNPILLTKGGKVLEAAVGAVFAPTRFSLVRISIRDLVADGKSLVRSSGVTRSGGQNLILIKDDLSPSASPLLRHFEGALRTPPPH